MTDKIAQLVVNNESKPTVAQSIEMTIGAQIKYVDDEVILVKTSVGYAGNVSSSHVVVEIPKE
jgi:hypothetical protein